MPDATYYILTTDAVDAVEQRALEAVDANGHSEAGVLIASTVFDFVVGTGLKTATGRDHEEDGG